MALEERVKVLLISLFIFLGQEIIHIMFAHSLMVEDACMPTNVGAGAGGGGETEYEAVAGIFGELYCYSIFTTNKVMF